MIVQIIINGLILGLVYALVALGFNIIYNATRIFHIAHGAVYVSAAYFYIFFSRIIHGANSPYSQLMIVFLSIICVAGLGISSELLVYRRLRKSQSPLLIYLIASLGFYIVSVNIIAMIFGNETQILSSSNISSYHFAGITVTKMQLIELMASPILITSTIYLLANTILGKVIRAMSDNQTLVQVLGYNSQKYRILILGIGSILAGVASLMVSFDVGVDPQGGLVVFLTASVAVIVGGTNSVYGSIMAAIFIGVIQNLSVWFFSAQWQDAVTFIILIGVLIIRKKGLSDIKLRLEEE